MTREKPSRNQLRSLDDMYHASVAKSYASKGTLTEFLKSSDRGTYEEELAKLNRRFLGPKNVYHSDGTQNQAYFEPKGWVQPLPALLEVLTGVYFTDAIADQDYVQQRTSDPLPDHFVRVPFLKVAFYERLMALENGYKEIGVPIEHICGQIEGQRKFQNYRKGALGPKDVYFHPETEECRREIEKQVPGDVMIIDVDTSNWALGECKTTHTPRWSREEVLLGDKLFSLSATDVGLLVLTNPNRLQRFEDLCIDAVAEIYVWGGSPSPSRSLYFFFDDDGLEFDHRNAGDADSLFAAAVGLRPGVPGLL